MSLNCHDSLSAGFRCTIGLEAIAAFANCRDHLSDRHLGVVPGVLLALGPWRAARRPEILSTGQAAVGTIVTIDAIAQGSGRGGTIYGVAVEFTPAGFKEPQRVQLQLSAREADKLAVYQQVPIHYRDEIPIAAVIDKIVRWAVMRRKKRSARQPNSGDSLTGYRARK